MIAKRLKTVIFLFAGLWYCQNTWAQDPEIRAHYIGLDNLLNEQSYFGNHFTGFMLFDLDSQRVLFEKNSHLNFIPASVTKLLTFYGGISVLGDRLAAFRYVESGKSVKIWGTGYPLWEYRDMKHPDLDAFLAKYDTVYFSDQNWKDEPYGYGWQWDDFFYSYSVEKSAFPIYGNFVTFKNSNRVPKPNIPFFDKPVSISQKATKEVMRELWSNNFYFNPASYTPSESEVPFITSSELFASLVSERIKKPVVVIKDSIPSEHLVFEVEGTKEVWREMLQESDNFLAEQLLLMAGEYQTGELNTERAIDYIQKTFLWDLPDQPNWMDGSGLSRNNLVTPRAMIQLMVKLEQLIPREELKSFLAVGGVNGTLKNTYKGASPYIFAKTGTLSNNHSLVGIIKTDSGKHLAFAFMNNNYLQKASEVRREMDKVMGYVKQHF